jgi:glycosyltransferase involved in cell wall biosynthesis
VHVRLLIAIPVHNERKYVRPVLDKVRRFHRGDILVVDDGSTDGTSEILESIPQVHRIRHASNLGYGKSLIDAFAFADRQGYDWVITMDCDEQHEPAMIPEFVRCIESNRWDLISGSRYLQQRNDNDLPPSDRRRINGELTELVNRCLELDLTDTFCGYKAHRVDAMRRVHLDEAGYAFPMQLWPQVAAAAMRITELPVRLIYNDPTRHFGGQLDDAEHRLRHYLEVFRREMRRAFPPAVREVEDVCCCCAK